MAKQQESSICEYCGSKYPKCCFNRHHQKYCTSKRCVIKRRQERQRERYRRNYRNDKNFADKERERCREGIRKRREAAHAKIPNGMLASSSSSMRIDMGLLATGLLSQWIDSKDPREVEEAARRLEKRGQQLAITTLSVRGSGVFHNF
jgi:hypothetical protein